MDDSNINTINNSPELSSSADVNNVPQVKRPVVSPWVIVICLGLVFLVLLAVYIFVPGKNSIQEVKKIERNVNLSVSPTPPSGGSPEIKNVPLSSSDNVSDIEKDVNNTDVTSLDSELSSIEQQLSQ